MGRVIIAAAALAAMLAPAAAQTMEQGRYGAKMLAQIKYTVDRCGVPAPSPEKVARTAEIVERLGAFHVVRETEDRLYALERQIGAIAVCAMIKEQYR